MSVRLNSAGGGSVTLAAPSTASTFTLNLPAANGDVLVTGSTAQFGVGSASAPSITVSGDTNTGLFFPGADRIGFAEGGVQVGEFDASGNFLFNSGFGSTGIAYGCRAWVNFNGTGTVAIRASGNVSSITDSGTGHYRVNFATATPDANYSAVGTCMNNVGFNFAGYVNLADNDVTTSGVRVFTAVGPNTLFDPTFVCVAIFR